MDYPSNDRERTEEPVAEKRVERVTTNAAVRRKTPLGSKIRSLFLGGDAQSVGQYVVMEILVPSLRDLIADMVSQTVERMIYGDGSRSSGRRPSTRTAERGTYVSYNRISAPSRNDPPWRREESRMTPRNRATHNFDEIILATRHEAEEVLNRLDEIISRYKVATVGDLYDLVGEPTEFTDQKWGWSSMRGAGVHRDRQGYRLELPRPEPLD